MATGNNNNINIVANFVDNASPQLDHLSNLLNDFGKGLAIGAIAAAVAFVSEKFVEATREAINFGDELNDMSERWGIAQDGLSGMAYAAKLADTSLEGITGGLRHLAKSMEEARDPASDQAQLFAAMGISMTDAEGKMKSADEMMGELADQFKDMPNGMEKARLAMQIFGKAGADLIPYLNQGSEGIKKMKDEAKGFGLFWTPEQSAQAADFNDNMDRMTMAVQGLFTRIAQALLPTLGAVAEAFVESAKEGGILKGVFDIIVGAVKAVDFVLKPLILGVYILTNAFSLLGRTIGGVAAATVEFLSGNFEGSKNIINGMKEDLAKTGDELLKFHAKLYDTKPAAEEAGKGAENAVPSIKKVGESAKKVAEEIEKYLAGLRKVRDEIGANEEMKQRIELEAKLLELKKQGASTAQLAKVRNEATSIIAETNARRENWDLMQKQLDAEIKLNDVRKSTISATEDIKFENSLMALSDDERKIAIELRKLEKQMIGASKEEIAKLSAERRKELEVQQEQNRLENLLADTVDVKIEKSRQNMQVLTRAFESGAISEKQYLEAVQLEMERVNGKAKATVDEMTEFFKEAARNIQGAMSDFLFDFMQGKLGDMGKQIKTMIDRMVANFLAAKAATALFGSDFGTKGEIGGLIGDVFSGIAGARAEGGPVEAGKTYLVGERRAELFTPSVNGTILPDAKAATAGYARPVQITIQAMDSQDALRGLQPIMKDIARGVNIANNKYNLKGGY